VLSWRKLRNQWRETENYLDFFRRRGGWFNHAGNDVTRHSNQLVWLMTHSGGIGLRSAIIPSLKFSFQLQIFFVERPNAIFFLLPSSSRNRQERVHLFRYCLMARMGGRKWYHSIRPDKLYSRQCV